MNVKLTSFSLSRCKMIVPSKSRPGLGVRLHLSRVLDPSIGGHHLQYLHYTALPTLCQAGKRISAQQTENSFMRPRILSGPWAVGLNIFDHISIYIYVSKYLHSYLYLRIYNSIFTMDRRSDSAALAAWCGGYERWYAEVSVL